MIKPVVSVIVPTIDGRSHWLARCKEAYIEHTVSFELIVLRNRPTCGAAWNEGIKMANGDYIHLSADDLEPHAGWWEESIKWSDEGFIPCPRILNGDGTLQSCGDLAVECDTGTPTLCCRVPFLRRDMVDAIYPIFDNQYMGDYWITREARALGWESVVVREVLFTHHLAPEGRIDSLPGDLIDFEQSRRNRRRRVSR